MEIMPELSKISFSFPGLELFRDLSVNFREGDISCILGPSGCGKTTLLNLICELSRPDRGEILGFPKGSFSYIFQETRILPWKTVYENIAFPLIDKTEPALLRTKVEKYIELVELSEWKDEYPSRLSGGMKQRIAIARAFAYPSSTILMDEAFQGLDIGLKKRLFEIFLRSWTEEQRTVIFVTHDLDEALYLGNHIFVLSGAPNSKVREFPLSGVPGSKIRINNSTKAEISRMLS